MLSQKSFGNFVRLLLKHRPKSVFCLNTVQSPSFTNIPSKFVFYLYTVQSPSFTEIPSKVRLLLIYLPKSVFYLYTVQIPSFTYIPSKVRLLLIYCPKSVFYLNTLKFKIKDCLYSTFEANIFFVKNTLFFTAFLAALQLLMPSKRF